MLDGLEPANDRSSERESDEKEEVMDRLSGVEGQLKSLLIFNLDQPKVANDNFPPRELSQDELKKTVVHISGKPLTVTMGQLFTHWREVDATLRLLRENTVDPVQGVRQATALLQRIQRDLPDVHVGATA